MLAGHVRRVTVEDWAFQQIGKKNRPASIFLLRSGGGGDTLLAMSDTKINDGGPAFPVPHNPRETGMSLRQYAAIKLRVPNSGTEWLDKMIIESNRNELAGQALAGWLASFDASMVHPVRNNTEDSTAMACYKMADAMISASNAK